MFLRISLLAWLGFVAVSNLSAQQDEGAITNRTKKYRMGVYDSRAITIAFAASKHNPVAAKMKEMKTAQKNGDKNKISELMARGRIYQKILHRQGFMFMPVGDLLRPVHNGLEGIAKRGGLVGTTRKCDYVAGICETIDVTNSLVELFNPSEKTLRFVASIRKKPPVSFDDLEAHEKSELRHK